MKRLILISAIAVAMSACTPITGSKQGDGTLIGAGAGAVIGGALTSRLGVGGQVAGVVGGALLGGLIGGSIGAHLDEQDRIALEAMTRHTASTGGNRSYVNRRTGVRLSTRSVGTSTNQSAQVCRTVEQTITTKDGSKKSETIQSCRGANGWTVG